VGRKGTLDPTRVAAFQAASLLKIGGRRYRNLDVREWAQVPALMEAALELLEEGESLAPAAGAGGSR